MMEMTDRRSAARSSRSDSYMSSSTTSTADWCDDTLDSRVIRSSSSVGSNGSRSGGFSKLRKYHIILCLLLVFTILNLMNQPSVIDPIDMGHVEMKNHTEAVQVATTVSPSESQEIKVSPLPTPMPTLPPSYSPTERKETLIPTKSPEPEPEPEPAPTETTIDENDDEPNVNNGDADTQINESPPPSATIIDENQDIDDNESNNQTQTEDTTPTTPPSTPPTKIVPSKNPTTTKIETSNQLAKPLSDSELSQTALNFAEAHCDLRQIKDGTWYPSGTDDDWKQRAPYFIIAGVLNAGVIPLKKALLKHPQIQASKTTDFFLPKTFSKFTTRTTSSNLNVKVFAARERMYAQVYSKAMYQRKTIADESETFHVGMDVSPSLLFYAQTTAPSVLCTTPWTKIIVVLQNPVDRLYRQWAYAVENHGLPISLEAWMAKEMKLLQKVGLLPGAEEGELMQFSSKIEAWNHYQSVPNDRAIGRSLYVFQLEQWIQAYVSAGKNPSQEILIVTTEDIVEDPVQQHAEILQFLGLNNSNDDSSVALALGNALSKESNLEPMAQDTRKMLQRFFKPYNKDLTELLTSNGFEGDWYKRWK